MSDGAKNRKITPLYRKARSDNSKINPNYGMKGKHHSEETKKRWSIIRKGMPSAFKGKHHTEEAKRKLGEYKGKRASNWQGGKSFEPYSVDWTETLKRSIRERDNYICQLCGKTQIEQIEEIEKKLSVHHIDYNKKNCNPKNLTTLCNRCNARVNFNRDYWEKQFVN